MTISTRELIQHTKSEAHLAVPNGWTDLKRTAAMIDRLVHHCHVDGHQRNAKLQLTVVLADAEPVAGLYGRVEYRRHRVRPPVERPNGV